MLFKSHNLRYSPVIAIEICCRYSNKDFKQTVSNIMKETHKSKEDIINDIYRIDLHNKLFYYLEEGRDYIYNKYDKRESQKLKIELLYVEDYINLSKSTYRLFNNIILDTNFKGSFKWNPVTSVKSPHQSYMVNLTPHKKIYVKRKVHDVFWVIIKPHFYTTERMKWVLNKNINLTINPMMVNKTENTDINDILSLSFGSKNIKD